MEQTIEDFFKNLKIAIIGGTGGMGKIFVKNLKNFSKVMICSRNLNKARKVANEFGNDIQSGLLSDCNDADIVIVSVPIESILDNSKEVLKIMKPGSLLMDQSSVKSGVIDKLVIPESIEYISAHCLFGPEGDFLGQNILLIPVKEKIWLSKITKLLEKLGSNVFIISFKEHDELMSKIQVLFHFSLLSMVVALSKSNINSNFYTRSFKMMIPTLNTLKKNLETILEIQKNNPFSKKMRNFFTTIVNELNELDFYEFEKLVRENFEKLEI